VEDTAEDIWSSLQGFRSRNWALLWIVAFAAFGHL